MNDELQKARDVLRKHRTRWLGMPGVVGAGVGSTGDGRVAIVISVSGPRDMVRELPDSVDGVRVVVQETGGFRALE